MKLIGVVITHVYYNFTKLHQNRMKNKKVLLMAHFSVQNFKVSVELWKSYIVRVSKYLIGWCSKCSRNLNLFISTGWHGKLKLSENFSHLFPYSFDRLVDQSISLLFQFTPLCQRVGLRGLRAHPVELLEAEGSVRLVTLDISLHWVFILSSQIWRFRAQWWLRLFRDFVFTVLLFRKCLGSQEQVVYSQDVTEPVTHIKQNFRTTKSLAGLCCLWLL